MKYKYPPAESQDDDTNAVCPAGFIFDICPEGGVCEICPYTTVDRLDLGITATKEDISI